uniref:G-protein coupled receptors family 1 profile domain-containing protein n=1 Tax=Panagrolaimus sp. ES5 TaxID=591445 RepID=A0AC34FN54_9BILA
MKGRTNMLLSLVAIVDIIFLTLLSLNYLGQYTFAVRSSPECLQTLKTDCMSWYYKFYINYKSQLTFSVNLCSKISTWLIVTVCFDRLWAIKTPLKCHGATCSKSVLTSVIAICIFSIILSCFHNFAFQVVRSNSTYNITGMNNGLHTRQPSPYQLLIKVLAMIEVCFQILVPMILLVISNSLLLYYLRNRWQHFQVQRWNPSKNSFDSCQSNENNDENRSSKIWSRRHSTNERKVTTTVFGIVCCYIVSNLPSGILFIFIYIVNSGEWYKTKRDYAFVFLSTGIVKL